MKAERIEAALRQGPPEEPAYEPILGSGGPPTSVPVVVPINRGPVRNATPRGRSRIAGLAAGLATLVAGGALLTAYLLRPDTIGPPAASPASSPSAVRSIPGQAFLGAVQDWHSRHVSGVSVGIMLDGRFYVASALMHASTWVNRVGPASRLPLVAVVLQLVDDGVLGLDDTLEQHGVVFPRANRITVRMLLSGSSGVPAFGEPVADLLATIRAEPEAAWGPADALAIAAGRPSRFQPGESQGLVDTDDALLGVLVDVTSGAPASESMRARVLDPIDLPGTYLYDEAIPPPGTPGGPTGDPRGPWELARAIVSGSDLDQLEFVDDIDPDLVAVLGPARGMATTGYGLTTLVDALHADVRLVPSSQRTLFDTAFEDGGFAGSWACPCDDGTPRALVVGGTVGLYTSYVAWFPADGTTIGAVANRGLPPSALAELIETAYGLIEP